MKFSVAMKRFGTFALAGTVCLTVLAGCGPQPDSSTTSNDTDSTASSITGTIDVVSREDGSGTRGAFIELFGIETKDGDQKVDHTTQDAIIANQTEVMMQNISGDENAIGYASLGSMNESVKAVKIDGAQPTTENVLNSSYKISRPFNVATKGELSGAAQDFMNYILSADGQQVIADNGYIQVNQDARPFTSDNSAGEITVAGSSSVTPVMEKLKEAYEQINSNVSITIQESDSTTGILNTIEGVCDIGMASRDLSDEELTELTPVQIALDGIAVIVNPSNPIDELTSEQVYQIFTGEVTDWSEV